MPRLTAQNLMIAVGVLLIVLSVLADAIGLGHEPGFGWKQGIGLAVGLALVVGSILWGRISH